MKIVLDTNAVIASLIRDSSSRKIILSPKFDFFAPDFSFEEINRHKKEICKKAGIDEYSVNLLLNILFQKISLVHFREYETLMKKAIKIMENIDIDDSPFIACALHLKADGIWTEDKGFLKQNKVRIFSTGDMLNLI